MKKITDARLAEVKHIVEHVFNAPLYSVVVMAKIRNDTCIYLICFTKEIKELLEKTFKKCSDIEIAEHFGRPIAFFCQGG